MQIVSSQPNCVNEAYLYVFGNFTPENLSYIKTIKPRSIPIIHVFLTQNVVQANNNALLELIRHNAEMRRNFNVPTGLKIYVPARHPDFSNWVQAWLTNRVHAGDYLHDLMIFGNEQRFSVPSAPKKVLICKYEISHDESQQFVRFSIDELKDDGTVDNQHIVDFPTIYDTKIPF